MSLMPGFTARNVRANGLRFHTWIGGDGPPLVLVHGYPQSGIMWRKVAPTLAQHYTVVVPDLRGYGDSDKPRDGFDKKTMASDLRSYRNAAPYRPSPGITFTESPDGSPGLASLIRSNAGAW